MCGSDYSLEKVLKLFTTPVASKGPKKKRYPVWTYGSDKPSTLQMCLQIALTRFLIDSRLPAKMILPKEVPDLVMLVLGDTPVDYDDGDLDLSYARVAAVGTSPQQTLALSKRMGERPVDLHIGSNTQVPQRVSVDWRAAEESLLILYIQKYRDLKGNCMDATSVAALYLGMRSSVESHKDLPQRFGKALDYLLNVYAARLPIEKRRDNVIESLERMYTQLDSQETKQDIFERLSPDEETPGLYILKQGAMRLGNLTQEDVGVFMGKQNLILGCCIYPGMLGKDFIGRWHCLLVNNTQEISTRDIASRLLENLPMTKSADFCPGSGRKRFTIEIRADGYSQLREVVGNVLSDVQESLPVMSLEQFTSSRQPAFVLD